MTRLLHADATQLIVRRPNGQVLVDTNNAPPTLEGKATFSSVAIVFTEAGHGITDGYVPPYWRRNYPGGRYHEPDVVLGASGLAAKPDLLWGRFNLTQTHGSVWLNSDRVFTPFIKDGEWTPFTGSALLERQVDWSYLNGDTTACVRYFYIEWVAGNWVLKPRWSVRHSSSSHYDHQINIPNSYGRFFGTIELAWGSYFEGDA